MKAKKNERNTMFWEKYVKKSKITNSGITLVALVVTIVILLILAGITIMYVMGDNSVFKMARDAKTNTEQAVKNEQEYMNNLGNTINGYVNGGGTTNLPKEPINTTTSYVGYYADIEGDGEVDGIIYVDLAVGKTATGNWGNDEGTYEIKAVTTGLKEYYVSKTGYTGAFGTKDVLSPIKGSSGTDRFYVMALEDVQLAHPVSGTENSAYWYYNAYGKMTDYSSYRSLGFGSGKENTKKMIARWKKTNTEEVPNATAVDYGEGKQEDMWGQIETEVAKGWFVPSNKEWIAFGKELGIGGPGGEEDHIYTDCGLSDFYWSSTQYGEYSVWGASFSNGFGQRLRGEDRRLRTLGCDFLILYSKKWYCKHAKRKILHYCVH